MRKLRNEPRGQKGRCHVVKKVAAMWSKRSLPCSQKGCYHSQKNHELILFVQHQHGPATQVGTQVNARVH